MTKDAEPTASRAKRMENDRGHPANPQKRGAGEKPRDKPVEEEADKDIKQRD
jgi:hypothetical protein